MVISALFYIYLTREIVWRREETQRFLEGQDDDVLCYKQDGIGQIKKGKKVRFDGGT